MLVCWFLFAFICTNSRSQVADSGFAQRRRSSPCRLVGSVELASSSTLDEDPFRQAARQVAPGFAAQPLGIRRRALGGDIEALRAVGAQHFAYEPEPSHLETGKACDRRPA